MVRGIPVIRQMSPVSSIYNEPVECLKKGDSKKALLWLLENGSAPGVRGIGTCSQKIAGKSRIKEMIRGIFKKAPLLSFGESSFSQAGFESALRNSRPPGYADYFFHRYANPSLLGAIPFLVILGDICRMKSSRLVVELLCGIGHSSALIAALFPELKVVSADIDFVNLFLAKTFLARNSAYLCMDAELPLPFKESSVGGLICVDGLHYVRSKAALLQEVDRVVSADGNWLFAHMHNLNTPNPNLGAPLSAEGYETRFAFGQNRLLPEIEVLRQFQTDGSLDLTVQAESRTLVSSHALTLIGGRPDLLWKKHSGVENSLCRLAGLIDFNPIYQMEEASGGLTLRPKWPSDWLRSECAEKVPILPDEVHVPSRVLKDISSFRKGGSFSEEVRKLLLSFVLVPLPECYPRKTLPGNGGAAS